MTAPLVALLDLLARPVRVDAARAIRNEMRWRRDMDGLDLWLQRLPISRGQEAA